MRLCYARCGRISAEKIADAAGDIELTSSRTGDINWGKETADTALNSNISNVTNKRVMRELFRDNDVPMPKLLTQIEAEKLVEDGEVVIGRPDKHSKGRGFWRCQNLADIRRALRGTRRKRAATHFMSEVKADREYRVHIFMRKSLRVSEKLFFVNDKGKKDYTTGKPDRAVVKHVRKAARRAMRVVGLDFGAVDILANDTECWVLEINAAPGLGGSMPRIYAEAFERWYDDED